MTSAVYENDDKEAEAISEALFDAAGSPISSAVVDLHVESQSHSRKRTNPIKYNNNDQNCYRSVCRSQ